MTNETTDLQAQARETEGRDAVPAAQPSAWPAVWSLAVVVAALNASEMLPASLLTPMAASLGASEGVIGQGVTATAILAITTSLLIARVTRRLDRRLVLLMLTGALVASNLAVSLAPNAEFMLAARLVLGLTVGGVWGLAASVVMRLVPSGDVPKALSIVFGGASVAVVAAAPLGAFFGGIIGWRGVFAAVAALSAVALVAQHRTVPSMPPAEGARTAGPWATLRLPGLAAGMLGVMLLFGGTQAFLTYLRPFLESVTHLGTGQVSLTLLLFGVANLLGTMLAAPLLQRSIWGVLSGVAASAAILLAVLASTDSAPIVAMLLIAGWGFSFGMVSVGWSTWVTRAYPDHAEGAGGVLVAAIQGSMMLGAIVGGALIEGVGAAGPLYAAIAALGVGAVYVGTTLRPRGGRA
jgi:predicted MFS family arabinose efflux permease